MGRAARLKHNPDRERYASERDAKERLRRSLSGGRYRAHPSRSFEDMAKATAMHEAGHVVSALALGLDVEFAVLRATRDAKVSEVGGYTEISLRSIGPSVTMEQVVAAAQTPEMLRVRSIQVLAGQVAESVVNESPDDVDSGSEGDDKAAVGFAMQALRQTVGEEPTIEALEEYLDERMAEAHDLIRAHVAPMVAVANYLLAHQNIEIQGERLRTMMSDDGAEAAV
jgi:hypothetical protein